MIDMQYATEDECYYCACFIDWGLICNDCVQTLYPNHLNLGARIPNVPFVQTVKGK
jgi:hypothetical protein